MKERFGVVVTAANALVLPYEKAIKMYVSLVKEGVPAMVFEYNHVPVCKMARV